MKKYLHILLIASLTIAVSCKTKNTEEEKLKDLKSSLKYKTYKKTSELTVPTIIAASNMSSDSVKCTEGNTRLMLGYCWAVAKKTEFALAETYIIEDKEKDEQIIMLNYLLRSIALYEAGLNTKAHKEAEKGYALVNKNPDNAKVKNTIAIYHLLIGSACIYDKNFKAARFHFAGFGLATEIYWPNKIVDAICDLEDRNPEKALKTLKDLNKDSSTPSEVKEVVTLLITEIEKNSEKYESLLSGNTISKIIIEELKTSSIKGINSMMSFIEELTEKLG